LADFISAVAFATILGRGFRIAHSRCLLARHANDLVVGLSGQQLDERMRLRISRSLRWRWECLGSCLDWRVRGRMSPTSLLATAIAASANFPLLLLAIYWDGLTTRGASLAALRPYLIGCFDGNGANIWSKGTGSWFLRSFRTTRRHCSRCPSRWFVCWRYHRQG